MTRQHHKGIIDTSHMEYDGTPYESNVTCEQALRATLKAVRTKDDGKGFYTRTGWRAQSQYRHLTRLLAEGAPDSFQQRCEVRDYVRRVLGVYDFTLWELRPRRTRREVEQLLTAAIKLAHEDGR